MLKTLVILVSEHITVDMKLYLWWMELSLIISLSSRSQLFNSTCDKYELITNLDLSLVTFYFLPPTPGRIDFGSSSRWPSRSRMKRFDGSVGGWRLGNSLISVAVTVRDGIFRINLI